VGGRWRLRVELEFDGAFSVTDVWVNGAVIGEHRAGYTGFVFDITSALQTGALQVKGRLLL
jgi:beta-galactosidase